jgi:hypothetical protein
VRRRIHREPIQRAQVALTVKRPHIQ